jgi:hypothetical protein
MIERLAARHSAPNGWICSEVVPARLSWSMEGVEVSMDGRLLAECAAIVNH